MGYNESCTVNNCTWHCCNYNGDCPEWYSNGQWQYTECYYYYGVDPTLLIWTTTFALVGALVIIIVACCCYKDYKKRQEELLKDNAEFQISQANIQTKNVMSIGKPNLPVFMSQEIDDKEIKQTNSYVPYGQPIERTKTVPIYGIGSSMNKEG